MCRGLYYETLELQIDMPNSRIVFNILNADARLILCQKKNRRTKRLREIDKVRGKERERENVYFCCCGCQ